MKKIILIVFLLFVSSSLVFSSINTPIPEGIFFNCDGNSCNGINWTNLNASQLTTGIVPDARISGSYNNITDLTIDNLVGGKFEFNKASRLIKIFGGDGTIESDTGNLTLKPNSGRFLRIDIGAGQAILPVTDNSFDIGTATNRIRDFYLGGFISDGTNDYTLADLNTGTWPIQDANIDFGTGTNQVSAVDIPIADGNDFYDSNNVEGALQDVGFDVNSIMMYYNGTFDEFFDAFVASDGATVTMSLEKSGGGDLTMHFLVHQYLVFRHSNFD